MQFAPRIMVSVDLSLEEFPAITNLESLVAFGYRLAEEIDGTRYDRSHVCLYSFDSRHSHLALVGSEVAGCACDFLPQEGEFVQQLVGDTIGGIACIDKTAVAIQSAETSRQ